MASINMDAILAKAKTHVEKNKGKLIAPIVDSVMLGNVKLSMGGSIHSPEEAASKFIEVLKGEIANSVSPGAAAAISDLSFTSPTKMADGVYSIGVYFSGDLSRPSLDADRYGGIDNLAALFNNGVDHTMKPVHGTWHGVETWSRTKIPGAHFMQNAVSSFMGSYASIYNVINISVSSNYS